MRYAPCEERSAALADGEGRQYTLKDVSSAARADFPKMGERRFRDSPAAGVALWMGINQDA